MVMIRLLTALLLVYPCVGQADDRIVVHLQPPALTLDRSLAAACDRPRRIGGINISLEERDNALVLHCYGHGGSGFTTLFGSIQESLQLLMRQNVALDTPIRVIGSGCMGLTMAIELYRKGYTHITLSTKERYQIPSWRAGGFFDPGVGNELSFADIHRLKLGLLTYGVLYTIEHGNHAYLTPAVVRRLPIYYPIDINCEVEILDTLHLMPPRELVTLDFGNGVVHENYRKQWTYFIDVTELMNQLWAYVEYLGIPVVCEEVTSFSECSEPIICNCAGLGNMALTHDSAMVPTRGHFFMLEAQDGQEPLEYMLFTKVLQNDRKEILYFFPKSAFRSSHDACTACSGMLGGTFIPYNPDDSVHMDELDEHEFATLAQRAQAFFYGAMPS